MRFNNIAIAEASRALPGPVKPMVILNLALGAVVGAMLGLGIALGKEAMDRRIRGPEEVENELGIACLGLLPTLGAGSARSGYYAYGRRRQAGSSSSTAAAISAPELAVHIAPQSTVAEAARSMRTNLAFASPDNRLKRILVTSSSPGEGKTMVASTIAIAFAQTGENVLLVDCDLRRSRLHRVFSRTNDYGVTSATRDSSEITVERLATNIPNLHLLPSGPRVPNPAELLQSESFARLLEELSSKFDRVVIDSPPIAAVTDAVILSTRVDGTVFVVRPMKTVKEASRASVRTLRDVNAVIAGCVLNCVTIGKRGYSYYRYYYKHGYGTYSQENETAMS